MGAFYLSTAMVIYLLWFWPFADNFFTRIEVMNEVTSILMLYLMLVFSDWVPDPEVRYTFGWVYIGVFCVNGTVHFFFLLRDLLKRLPFEVYIKCRFKKKRAVKAPASSPEATQSLTIVEEVNGEEEPSEKNSKQPATIIQASAPSKMQAASSVTR